MIKRKYLMSLSHNNTKERYMVDYKNKLKMHHCEENEK